MQRVAMDAEWLPAGAAQFEARCDAASECATRYALSCSLRGEPLTVSLPSQSSPKRRAWMTLLTASGASYANGVKALHNSLMAVESAYPLIVVTTPGLPAEVMQDLVAHGCEFLTVEAVPLPTCWAHRVSYASPQFAECWNKLRLWELEAFESIVYVDADMIDRKSVV